ncbi:hypothetical protein [Roseateles microcysteis]|uniref:hypothetical protein n=1 Tax=Roseateles microcysteis TaxID=3119057 RepID=UPI002FE61C74
MYIVAIAWAFVVLLMALTEATSSQGTVIGAFFTLLLYGVLPLSIVLYLMGTPARRAARRKAETQEPAASQEPDGSDHAAGERLMPERKEP